MNRCWLSLLAKLSLDTDKFQRCPLPLTSSRTCARRVLQAGHAEASLLRITNPYKQWRDRGIGVCFAL